MGRKWFYVEGNEKIGPVDQVEIENLFGSGKILRDTFVWTEGLENWVLLEEEERLSHLFKKDQLVSSEPESIDWENISPQKKQFTILVPAEDHREEKTYGLFSLEQLIQFGNENRLNEKSLIFTYGMEGYECLGNLPIFKNIFSDREKPPIERRENPRRPIIARVLFHDNKEAFDGVVANISQGGLRIFMNYFPGKIGDHLSMNVHPEDRQYSFVTAGEVVHILDGQIGFSVKFIELSPKSEKTLNALIKSHS